VTPTPRRGPPTNGDRRGPPDTNGDQPLRVRGRRAVLWALLAVLGQLAVRGAVAGAALMAAPSGAAQFVSGRPATGYDGGASVPGWNASGRGVVDRTPHDDVTLDERVRQRS